MKGGESTGRNWDTTLPQPLLFAYALQMADQKGQKAVTLSEEDKVEKEKKQKVAYLMNSHTQILSLIKSIN